MEAFMRRRALPLLFLLSFSWAGLTQAQVVPMTSLEESIDEMRAQAGAISQMLVGARLNEPENLHALAGIVSDLARALDRVATHAEHGQLTGEQREAIRTEVARTGLMLEQLSEQIRTSSPP
jgi:hypothetical protein